MAAGDYERGYDPTAAVKQSRKLHVKNKLAALSASITFKIEDGDIKAVLWLLSSEDKPAAADNDATINALMEKHSVAIHKTDVCYLHYEISIRSRFFKMPLEQ